MIEELLNYQAIDSNLRKIELALAGSEEKKKAVTAKKYLEGVEDNLAKLESRSSDLLLAYQKVEEDLNKLKEQESEFVKAGEEVNDLNGVEYLTKKIDEISAQIKQLGASATKIGEEIQNVLKEYSNLKSSTKLAQVQLQENAEKYKELKNSYQEEMDKIKAELTKLAKKVDPSLMERYNLKRNNKIYPVVYEVNGEVCGACNMQLSMSELNKLKNGEIIECDQCGRLLYCKQK